MLVCVLGAQSKTGYCREITKQHPNRDDSVKMISISVRMWTYFSCFIKMFYTKKKKRVPLKYNSYPVVFGSFLSHTRPDLLFSLHRKDEYVSHHPDHLGSLFPNLLSTSSAVSSLH